MTRGRKKDLSIPPSRALTQQRDYRARKALYLSELENRCQMLQEENERLRTEITAMRAGMPFRSPPDPQLTEASSELICNLETTKQSLERFQSLAYKEGFATNNAGPSTLPAAPSRLSTPIPPLRPAYFPSPEPSESSHSWSSSTIQRNSPSRASSERPWPDETYKPPESLRKILCDPLPEQSSYSPSLSLHSLVTEDSPPGSDDDHGSNGGSAG
ncbi:hypothetical protein V5O48_006452 [Marasmius crinis-equi]|uniref:BZIP domain-containing protein n=1 Tax=Marasmius crinis-equi TaxID=585013 RepID=A0ABR3FJJ0_9AGAR